MGQRLNIEIIENGQVQANAYYHWSGYTSSTLRLTQIILNELHSTVEQEKVPVLRAIRLLEKTGALLNDEEMKAAKEHFPNETFELANSRNNGLLAFTEDGIQETREWEEGRMTIDLDQETIFTDTIYRIEKEAYMEDYEVSQEEYEALPLCDFSLEDVSFKDFPQWCETVLGHIQNACYHLRLEDGDIISFVE